MDIYIIKNGEQAGPYTRFKLREQLAKGEIDEKTLGWYRGLGDWKPLSEIEALKAMLGESEEAETVEEDAPEEEPGAAAEPIGEEEGLVESKYSPSIQAWIRFWARNIDFTYFTSVAGLAGVASGKLTTSEFQQPTLSYFLILMVAWVFFESVLLSVLGNTPGRALLGIKVTTDSGGRLSTGTALKRSSLVWFRGMGFGYPFFSILTMVLSYAELTRLGYTWWDQKASTRVYCGRVTFLRVALAILFAFALVYLVFLVGGVPTDPNPVPGGAV